MGAKCEGKYSITLLSILVLYYHMSLKWLLTTIFTENLPTTTVPKSILTNTMDTVMAMASLSVSMELTQLRCIAN